MLGEDDPLEMKQFIQELGLGSGMTGGPPTTPAPFPVQLVSALGCGAVTAVSGALLHLGLLADKLLEIEPLGKRLN